MIIKQSDQSHLAVEIQFVNDGTCENMRMRKWSRINSVGEGAVGALWHLLHHTLYGYGRFGSGFNRGK